MRKLFTIIALILFVSAASAQDNCLPAYNLPVETIQLSSGKLAYVEKGRGQTILFIHGLGGNLSHWLKSVNELSSSYKCVGIDLPGYGWSDKQVDTKGKDRLQFYADAISEFLKKKKIKRVVLVGHSMGGQIAVITALQNKRVKKLVLVAPAGLETFTEKEGQLLIGATLPSVFEKQDEVIIRNNFKLNFCETISAGVKGMLAHPVKDSLQYLSMPVLIVFGANEGLIPNKYLHPLLKTDELAKQSAGLIPDCKVKMIEKAGHMIQFEKSNETNLHIKNFLQ